jgi:hypothetical protein
MREKEKTQGKELLLLWPINFWDWDRKQNTCLPSPCTELDASGVAPVVHALSCIAVTKWSS